MLSACKLRIVSYFDVIINKIDLRVETAFYTCVYDADSRDRLNRKRAVLIKEIKECESINLNNLDCIRDLTEIDVPDEQLFKLFCFLVDRNGPGTEQLEDEAILGFLIIVDVYLSDEKLQKFKEILTFNDQFRFLEFHNQFFKLNYDKLYEPQMKVKYKLFESRDEHIIKTSHQNLFTLDELHLRNVQIDSLDPDSAFLFKHIKHLDLISNADANEMACTVKKFETVEHVALRTDAKLESKLFTDFSTMNIKVLESNSVSEYLNWRLFDGLNKLEELKVIVSFIADNPFTNLGKLKTLDLELNSIDTFRAANLFDLDNLECLRLRLISVKPNRFKLVDCDSIHLFKNCLRNMKRLTLIGVNLEESSQAGQLFHRLSELEELVLIASKLKLDELNSVVCNHSKLNLLSLSDNNIAIIELNHFDNFSSLMKLDLSYNKIGEVQKRTFSCLSLLSSLDLSFNQLQSLETGCFVGLENLKILNLSNNLIETSDLDAFEGLTQLKSLNLSSNRIQWLKKEMLRGLISLEDLKLSSNRIVTLEASIDMINLTNLDLSNNYIVHLKRDHFKQLTNLQDLNLSWNKIRQVDHFAFGTLHRLASLNLDYNSFMPLSSDEFAGLENLKELNLCNNEITALKSDIFVNLSSLKVLDLKINAISVLEPSTFASLTSLKTLKLDHNTLFSISKHYFTGLVSLETLRLSWNRIELVEAGSFVDLKNLVELNLDKNAICNTQTGSSLFDGLDKLENLNLNMNKFESFHPFYSADLGRKLVELKLEFNQISDLNKLLDSFKTISGIKKLSLVGNNIPIVKGFSFVNSLSSLEELNLGMNKIEELEPNAFESLPRLQRLYLHENRLSELSDRVFSQGLAKLERLELQYNQIRVVEDGAFGNLKQLHQVDIRGLPFPYLDTRNLEFYKVKFGLNKFCRILFL